MMFEQLKKWAEDRLTLFWTLQLCGWGAFGFSMFLATAAVLPIHVAALDKAVFTLLGLLLSLLLRALYRHLYDRHLAAPLIILISTTCSYLLALIWTGAFCLFQEARHDWGRGEQLSIARWSSLFDGGLYHAFILLAWSLLYFWIKHYRELQIQTARTLKAEALAHEAQLMALRYQLNPHFLFNTLNAISTLVAQGENAAANRMISRLSEFLRLTLESSAAPEVPLAAELDFVKRYLEIEQVRFGDRLKVEFQVAPEALGVAVPNLILQPLVENALRHGIATREAGGRLEINASCRDGLLQLEVRDDGPAAAGDLSSLDPGVGLSNTRARLDQLYGSSHRFELRPAEAGGCVVIIGLPL